MELRHSAMPEGPRPPVPETRPPVPEPDDEFGDRRAEETPASVAYRVDRRLTALRGAGSLIFAIVAVFNGDPTVRVFAIVAAAVLVAYTVRDLAAPVRLAADADGVTVVTGFAGRRRIPWSDIDRLRLDERRRLGTRSDLLEIDTGEQLHLFSSYDLGAPCWEVARTLARMQGPAPEKTDR